MIQIDYKKVLFSKNIAEYQALFEQKVSGDLGVIGSHIIETLSFGKVYYMFYVDKLVAFKILAYSVKKSLYLIQTPNGLKWINIRNYRIFNTKEEYFLYLENKCSPIVLEIKLIDLLFLPHFKQSCGNSKYLYNAYKWSQGKGKPIQEMSYVYDILFDGNKFIIYYKLLENCFDSYEECVQHQLNGMMIEEFDNEDDFSTITITFKKEIKPKIHTLRFIED